MQMPYDTAFDLLTSVHKLNPIAAEQAADLIEQIMPPPATQADPDPMLTFVSIFADLHHDDPDAAFDLLRQVVNKNQA